jgi:aspartate dehydrogenase
MANAPLRVGFIGLGTIGQGVVHLLEERGIDSIDIVGALVRDPTRPRKVEIPLVATLDQLLALRPDVVVEIAGHDGLREHGPATLRSGFNMIAVSVGVLAHDEVYQALLEAAEEGGTRMKVASGAIGALDAIAAARLGGLDRVTHTVRKPPSTLLGNDAPPLSAPQTVFSGVAREAAIKYPASVNVTAAVSLAGLGLDRTQVEIIADPAVTRNQHEITAEGSFGQLRFEVQGIPTDENPRTGRLVAMSILNTLLGARTPIFVG